MNAQQTELWTVMRLVTWGADFFRKRGISSPRLTMELMLAHLLKLTRFDLYLQFDRPLAEGELEQLRQMVKRRANREPLQYILGVSHFYKREFEVTPAVLIPRPETELLVEEALRRAPSLRCLDVGTGSGCIGLTIALERPETEVVAIDSSEDALEVARRNAELLGARNVALRAIDFFDDQGMSEIGSFDMIVSNPPYIPAEEIPTLEPEVREHEPHLALTDFDDGLRFYRRMLELLPRLLRSHGNVFLEVGYGQARELKRMFESGGYVVDVLRDLDQIERILWVQRTS